MSRWSPLRLLLLDDVLQVVGYGWKRHSRQLQFAVRSLLDHDVHGAELGDLVGAIFTEVAAAALPAFDSRSSDRFGHGQQVAQIEGRVPAGVILAMSGDADARRPVLELPDAAERF